MVNSIKSVGTDAVALQITKPARDAGLVEERDDESTRLAEVDIFAVDGALLVVDRDRVAREDVVELVMAAAEDTGAIYPGGRATVTIRGEGYQVQLPGAAAAGLWPGDEAPVATAPGLLVITKQDGTRLARDLVTIRNGQVA